mmetsp:Transcript_2591/g.5816  ORF Transcript_2591/g.5816 Transcript_2591/m.5816 type:complete len:218 (-) Transcript_2591:646-1299(-)
MASNLAFDSVSLNEFSSHQTSVHPASSFSSAGGGAVALALGVWKLRHLAPNLHLPCAKNWHTSAPRGSLLSGLLFVTGPRRGGGEKLTLPPGSGIFRSRPDIFCVFSHIVANDDGLRLGDLLLNPIRPLRGPWTSRSGESDSLRLPMKSARLITSSSACSRRRPTTSSIDGKEDAPWDADTSRRRAKFGEKLPKLPSPAKLPCWPGEKLPKPTKLPC